MSIETATWNLLNLARRDVSVTPASLLDQVAAPIALLFALRWADAWDAERATIAAFDGVEVQPLLPSTLRWSEWRRAPRALTEDEVGQVWGAIRSALSIPGDPRNTHNEVQLPTGNLLQVLAVWVDQFSLDTPGERQQASEALGEFLLHAVDSSRLGGELVTPRSMSRLMVALADPKPGERIYDPCFGAGGLLADAAEWVWREGREMSPGQWLKAQRIPLFGVERYSSLHLVAFVRLLLAGMRPALEIGDALEREAAGRHHDQGFDCVLADPPWGVKVDTGLLYDFPIKGRTSENLFVQHAVRSLRPGGRAVVSAPPGLLFRAGPDAEIRRWLLEECRLELVIRLPAKLLGYTSLAPTLLVIRRGPPAETVRFVEITSLPDSPNAVGSLARALLRGEDVFPNTVRSVRVSDLLRSDARLEVSDVHDASNDPFEALGVASNLRALRTVAAVHNGLQVRRSIVTDQPGGGAVPLIRVGDISEGIVRTTDRFVRPDAFEKVHASQWIRRGDVLFTIDGTIGKVAYVHYGNSNVVAVDSNTLAGVDAPSDVVGIASKGVAIIRPDSSALDARFLVAMLGSSAFRQHVRFIGGGQTIPHLQLTALRSLRVPVPPPDVQERVVRRLATRPGDGVEALLGVLTGRDDDPLTRLFTEHSAIGRLIAEGIPEEEELYQLGLDVFSTLRTLRNEAAHNVVDIDPYALRWLLTIGGTPIRRRADTNELPDFDALDATRTLLERALESAREVKGLVGRHSVRLTERLILWVNAATTRTAADFQLSFEHQVEPLLDQRLTVVVTITLSGRVPLRDFTARLEHSLDSASVPELAPGEALRLNTSAGDDAPWEREPNSLVLPTRVLWSARRVDGAFIEGAAPVILRRAIVETNDVQPSPEMGPSPYITGDVVENPEMFVGRRAVLDDIKTHLNGGTKVILLEGNRRTGKTSILRQLQRPEQGMLERWIPVECSFQGTVGDPLKDGIPTEGVFRLIVRDIGVACVKAGCPVPLPEMDVPSDPNAFRFKFARALNGYFKDIDPYEALQIYVDMVGDAIKPRRLLLMLDEFDKLQVGIDNGVTSPQVPENIRNLLQTRTSIAAILTGSRRLKRLREEYWSALFGFGHQIGVEPLEADEVKELVTRPVIGRLSFDDDAVALIAELTACQPYLVQSLCARVFDLAKHQGWSRIRREETLEAVSRMVKDNEHFDALWSYAGTERRRYLMCLCSRLADGTQRVNATLLNEHLAEAGIVISMEDVDADLKFLADLELVALTNTTLGPQYGLTIPLMRRWMEMNVDAEAQRRRAQQEERTTARGDGWGAGDGAYGDVRGDGSGFGAATDDDVFAKRVCDTCGAPLAYEASAPSGMICYACTEIPEGGFSKATLETVSFGVADEDDVTQLAGTQRKPKT